MRSRVVVVAAVVGLGSALGCAGAASGKILLPTVSRELQMQQAALAQAAGSGITPPAPPCPENGMLYPPPAQWPSGAPYPFGNCGLTEFPATSMPWGGNMAYWGGHVQVHPKEYLIYWGWGEPGAFPGQSCSPETLSEGSITTTLRCDPDGAGKYMADFVHQVGGTDWAKVSTQFYETDSRGNQVYVANDKDVLAGIWVDDSNDIAPLAQTSSSSPAGPKNTYWDLAEEALRAAAHFGVSGSALSDANFIVIQPPAYSDPNALNSGYCAFHDFTDPNAPGNSYYDGLKMPDGSSAPYISYTNMPYSLAINSGSVNDCGQSVVNSDPSNPNVGRLDGFPIVLGHEIEETITDPGAEYIDPTTSTAYGGWFDAADAGENGDKCAWVGANELTLTGPPEPVPGALGNIKGNAGEQFAVQSLWSNADDEGTGYCAGAGTDSPMPPAAYGTSSTDDTPSDTAAPSISGSPLPSQQLSAAPGGWTGSPDAYVYQWQRCDSTGINCSDVDGATSQRYTVTGDDVGHTLAVSVYGADSAGSGLAATSAPTSVVATSAPSPSIAGAPPPPPTTAPVTGAAASGSASPQPSACPAQATLRFALTPPRGRRVVEVQAYINGRLQHFYVGRNIRRIAFARPVARGFTLKLVEVFSNHKEKVNGWRYDGCRRRALRGG